MSTQDGSQKQMHTKHRLSMADISLAVLLVVTFFTSLYMRSLNSGIPYYYDSIGYSATVGGTFVAVFTLASTAMRLIGGEITDKYPHYTVLLVSLGGLLLGVVLPVISDNFWVVMVSRVFQGASFALATNVMTVAVMGSASRKHIGRRVGIKGVGTSLGTMLGAVTATWLLDAFGFKVFFGFYAVLMVVSIGAILLLRRADGRMNQREAKSPAGDISPHEAPAPKSAAAQSAAVKATTAKTEAQTSLVHTLPIYNTDDGATVQTSTVAKDSPAGVSPKTTGATTERRLKDLIAPYLFPQMIPFLVISFVQRIPQGFCIAFILIFAKYEGITAGATFFVAAGAVTMLCRLLGGNLFDSGKNWLLFPILCVEIIGFAALVVHPSFVTLIIAALGYGISVGGSSPFLKTIGAKSTPKEHWGVVNGELYFFGDIGKSVGAFFGGLAIDVFGKAFVPEVGLVIAILVAGVTGISLLMSRHIRASKMS